MTTCDVIRFEINDGKQKRPLYIGWMTAGDLDQLCTVPSFNEHTTQEAIAGNVLQPPIEDWQRPLIESKRNKITARYDVPGEFMPNPVLLSVGDHSAVKVSPKTLDGKMTGLYSLMVNPVENGKPPLMVLDGQHRISGLSRGSNKTNPIPFVLLYSEEAGMYPPQDSAKIFAEVSTESTGLKDLHREWMQFAFELDTYDPLTVGGPDNRRAMEVAAHLCHDREFGSDPTKINNPFLDCIQFNPEKPAKPAFGKGFAFSAIQMKDFALQEYFSQAAGSSHLSPEEVAEQIARACLALQRNLGTPPADSCFFGGPGKHQLYMEHGFMRAVLAKLLDDDSPDWDSLLNGIGFHENIWDFSTWVATTGGNDGNTSGKVAREVLIEALRLGKVPHGGGNLVDYMKGDSGKIAFVASSLTKTGRPSKDKKIYEFDIRSIRTIKLEGRIHLKLDLKRTTSNVGKIDIYDDDAPRQKEFSTATLKKGVCLDRLVHLNIKSTLYGGKAPIGELTVDPK